MPSNASPSPAEPRPPRGINHVVLNVRDLEVSHRFWTEILGFRCVAQLQPIPGHRPRMRFYSGVDGQGRVTHHDVALAEIAPADGAGAPAPAPWSLMPARVGLNHVAIACRTGKPGSSRLPSSRKRACHS